MMPSGPLAPIIRTYQRMLRGTNPAPRRAVFVDRDGVINENRDDHVRSWSEFAFLPGVLEALAELAGMDVSIVVITNQANVGRGLMTGDDLQTIHDRMVHQIEADG